MDHYKKFEKKFIFYSLNFGFFSQWGKSFAKWYELTGFHRSIEQHVENSKLNYASITCIYVSEEDKHLGVFYGVWEK